MDYSDLSYPALKHECAARGLGGAGRRYELIAKLTAEENHQPQPEIDPPRPPQEFSNWDKEGKWRRRPGDFISWEEEKRKAQLLEE